METIDLDALAAAIATQCGMRCTVSRNWSPAGTQRSAIQVALRDDAKAGRSEDWKWFEAASPEEMPRLRDKVASFIVQHRKEEAA